MEKQNLNELLAEGDILIHKDEDGNYTGHMVKNGVQISERQSDPQIVLQLLLTHG